MKLFSFCSISLGVLLLLAGFGFYAEIAFKGEGHLIASFFCCMSSLMFFNLPTVVQKWRARNNEESQDD